MQELVHGDHTDAQGCSTAIAAHGVNDRKDNLCCSLQHNVSFA
jgi:hypothetical protein